MSYFAMVTISSRYYVACENELFCIRITDNSSSSDFQCSQLTFQLAGRMVVESPINQSNRSRQFAEGLHVHNQEIFCDFEVF